VAPRTNAGIAAALGLLLRAASEGAETAGVGREDRTLERFKRTSGRFCRWQAALATIAAGAFAEIGALPPDDELDELEQVDEAEGEDTIPPGCC